MQTIAGIWRGTEEQGARRKTQARLEEAVRGVQRTAGAMLARWHAMGGRARRWAARRETGRERLRVVVAEWRQVVARQRGQWRASTRLCSERSGDVSDELTPRWMEEWSYRPAVSAVEPGSLWGWLLAYGRTHQLAYVRQRTEWAAWHARRWGGSGDTVWGRYVAAVRAGMRPVRCKHEMGWRDKCGAQCDEAVRIRREGAGVVVTGGTRSVRQAIMRAEQEQGESWDISGRRHMLNKRNQTRRQTTMTERALIRLQHGLEEPFGDG